MTTSSNTTKREKVTLKKSEVVPSNFHLKEKSYAPMVVIGGETTFGAWCDTKEEAAARLNHLEIATDYHNYPTKQEEGVYPERSRIMEELYNKSGRTNSIFTGLADEYVTVSNNNPQ
jgi:hypothetical protein